MSEKEPVDYYISNSIIDVLEETNKYGQQYVESHQDYLTNGTYKQQNAYATIQKRKSTKQKHTL